MFHFGDSDSSIPADVVAQHRSKQPGATMHVYADAGHAFNRDVDNHALPPRQRRAGLAPHHRFPGGGPAMNRSANAGGWQLHPQLAEDTHPVAHFALSELRLMDDANHPWLILIPAGGRRGRGDRPRRDAAGRTDARDRRRQPGAAGAVQAAQAQRRRAWQRGAAVARARDRALPGRHRLAASGMGHGSAKAYTPEALVARIVVARDRRATCPRTRLTQR